MLQHRLQCVLFTSVSTACHTASSWPHQGWERTPTADRPSSGGQHSPPRRVSLWTSWLETTAAAARAMCAHKHSRHKFPGTLSCPQTSLSQSITRAAICQSLRESRTVGLRLERLPSRSLRVSEMSGRAAAKGKESQTVADQNTHSLSRLHQSCSPFSTLHSHCDGFLPCLEREDRDI